MQLAFQLQFSSRPLLQALIAAQQRCLDMTPAWEQAGEILVENINIRFESEGPCWPPRKRMRVARGNARPRDKRTGRFVPLNHKLLHLTGNLQSSIEANAYRDGVTVGSDLPYASTHEFGDPRRNIPARPYIVSDQHDQDAISFVLQDYVMGALRRAA